MKIINAASRVLGYIATGIMIPMMVLTVVDVFLRFFFNSPITGVSEMTTLMMVCLPLAIAWAATNKRHVSIDLLMRSFSPRVQAIVDSVTLLLGISAVAFLVWRGFITSLFEMKFGYYASILLPIPIHPFHWVMILGMFMFCLVLLTELIQRVKEAITG